MHANAEGFLNSGNGAPPPRRRNLLYLLLFTVSGIAFLGLLSYDAADSDYLAGGMGGEPLIHNWLGYLGAYTAHFLLLAMGFTSYLFVPLLLLVSLRRFFGSTTLRPARWDYWVAILLAALGGCMLFGTWPDLLGNQAAALNIAMATGGVIGQRFCDPDSGWMRIVLNPAGNAILGAILLLVGLTVLWIYDWQGLIIGPWRRKASPLSLPAGMEAEDTPFLQRLVAKRAVKPKPPREAEPDASEPPADEPAPRPAPVPASSPARPAPASGAAAPSGAAPSAPVAAKVSRKLTDKPYKLPSPDLLNKHDDRETAIEPGELEEKKRLLQLTLDSFGIDAKVGDATCGPRVTLFEVLPAPGVKVERISQIANNIAMELRAVSLRVLTPIPGLNSVGIEVPNAKPATVSLRGLMQTPAWKNTQARIPLLIGRNISGNVVLVDLTKAPHLLIAGATGSGKSVCINALIMSMLCRFTPAELRLIMVDPKVVEFRAYEKLPHLVVPVISDIKKVPLALRWIIIEMEHRYRVLAKVGARNLEGFNSRPPNPVTMLDDDGNPIPERLPYIVLIIDELADIIMTAKADVETGLTRIAQLSGAVGIHAIVATQRPSVNVITGTIKANFPTRIAFQVTSQVDSRTILDGKGAESLLGRGDMLFKPPGAPKLERNQSAFVEDDEIERLTAFCASQAEQEFEVDIFKAAASAEGAGPGEELLEADEELIQKAIEIIVRDRRPTTSYVQRCLRIGYNRAALIMEILEQRGVIGPQVGNAPREILITGTGRETEDAADGDTGAESEPQTGTAEKDDRD